MKRFISTLRTPHAGKPAARDARRKGSILVIVIALLGMLLLLGIAFYTFASQEHLSSGYFAESTKERMSGVSAETLFDYGLEQLIVGPPGTKTQSVLYGRRHSLMGNLLGGINIPTGEFDPIPHNGTGAHLILSGGVPVVDNDLDGVADTVGGGLLGMLIGQQQLDFNISAAANVSGMVGTAPNVDAWSTFDCDVDYTYPDINSPFLAHVTLPADDVNVNPRPIIIPSFLRPQYMRNGSGTVVFNAAEGTNWYDDPTLKARTFRPHPEHLISGTGTPRYIRHSTANPSTLYSGAPYNDAPVLNVLGTEIEPFPFKVANGELGVWTDTTPGDATHAPYDLDVDNDNDGIKEGIWMDIDFPAQTLIDGRRYVPLFSYTVLNADGLINLNTAGNLNLANNNYLDASSADMQNQPISTSQQGASRTEVNPLWAFWGWSSGTLSNAQKNEYRFFRPASNMTALDGTMSRQAIANMELIHIKNGQKRDDGVGGDEYNVGEWGELATLQAGGFSSPGVAATDDDFDENTGLAASDPLLQLSSAIPFPRVGHPLDLRGVGLMTNTELADGTNAANGLVTYLANGPTSSPTQWAPSLWNFYHDYLDGSALEVANPALLTGTAQTLSDEADETIVDSLYTGTSGTIGATIAADATYGPDEMMGLHLTNTEFASVAGTSRLRNLAPINFADDDLRKQFTTIGFDREIFGAPLSLRRIWEWPLTTGIPGQRSEVNTAYQYRFRLALNGLIVGATALDADQQRRPIYRALTPHPTSGLTNTPITWPGSFPEPPNYGGNAELQEAYARYDRQRLARDIYVLLYHGGSGLNVALNGNGVLPYPEVPGTTVYTAAQLKEMAQFAVNVVDAIDRDDVVTRFEYDQDLSDAGSEWNLDDNPYTDDSGDREEVFGVEAQQLTISEFQAIRTKELMTDSALTQWDDQNEQIFSYLELRNSTPAAVNLNNQAWQIQIKTDPSGTTANQERRLILSNAGTVSAGGVFTIAGYSAADLPHPTDPANLRAPSQFMANFDNGATNWSASTYRIAPLHPTIDLDLVPSALTTADLSMVSTFQLHEKPASGTSHGDGARTNTIGDFITPTLVPSGAASKVTVILRRRLNPYRTPPVTLSTAPTVMEISQHDLEAADNPWIEVDRLRISTDDLVGLEEFATPENPTFTDVSNALTTLGGSSEHKEPFDPVRVTGKATTDPTLSAETRATYAKNSLGGLNEATKDISLTGTDSFTLWQPHFDREFSSIIDLFSIPLYGPENVTRFLKPSGDMTQSVYSLTGSDNDLGVELVAAKKFLRPDSDAATDPSPITLPAFYNSPPFNYPASTANLARWDNRWYRILEHLDIPSQTNRPVQWELSSSGTSAIQWPDTSLPPRLPGSINLNTVRHRSVLASLVDDPDDSTTSPEIEGHLNPLVTTSLTDRFEAGREWWGEFVESRDQIDPVTNLILPGLPGSRPFRSLSYADENAGDAPGAAMQHTLLRDLPLDSAAGPVRRNLFEARASGAANEVDIHARHRLLRKVANNSTARGNTFIVWMTVGFFEAKDEGNSVRIGAKLATLPEHRGFFIVDRSLLEKGAVQRVPLRFDYKKFIVYQKTLK